MASKFRDVTEADLGKRVEVTNDGPEIKSRMWSNRWLWCINTKSKHPFKVFSLADEAFMFARIEVPNERA